MTKFDFNAAWDEARSNVDRLRACRRHRFLDETTRLGQKVYCHECGGMMNLIAIGAYIQGYEAAGGRAEDVWPAWASLPMNKKERQS